MMVHPGGRPRTTTPPKEEVIKLGEELVAWASEETDELRCRFAQWYSIVKGITHNEWDLLVKTKEFCGYYEKAQTILGNKYLDGSIKDSIAHRFLRIYCPDVKRNEDRDAQDKLDRELEQKKKAIEHEVKLKSDIMQTVDEKVIDHHQRLLSQLSSLQMDLKNPKSNSRRE